MLRRLSLGFRVFLYATALVMASSFVLSASGFLQLVFLWGCYAILLSAVGVARRGWWRGLRAPAAALASMAYVGGRDAAALCLVAGLLSILLSVCVLYARSAYWKIRRYLAARFGRDRINERQLVSVAVRGDAANVCAADVLADFGFRRVEDHE
jgi:hypothetical protein